MVDVTIRVTPGDPAADGGWRYFWGKTVTGFDASKHCMPCLVGDRIDGIDPKLLTRGGSVGKRFKAGTAIYLCGVSYPYVWGNNLHLPFRAKTGARTRQVAYTGAVIEVIGGEAIPIVDSAAKAQFPTKGYKFLSCRNFQFGAAQFQAFVPEPKRRGRKRTTSPQLELYE